MCLEMVFSVNSVLAQMALKMFISLSHGITDIKWLILASCLLPQDKRNSCV